MAARWTTRWKPAVGFGSLSRVVTSPARSSSMKLVRLCPQFLQVSVAGGSFPVGIGLGERNAAPLVIEASQVGKEDVVGIDVAKAEIRTATHSRCEQVVATGMDECGEIDAPHWTAIPLVIGCFADRQPRNLSTAFALAKPHLFRLRR